jgi:predicted nucleic acid-binding Zn ribbon protein
MEIGGEAMPFCPNCGTEVSEDTRFCPECGVPLVVEQVVKAKNKKKIAGIIIACIITIIIIVIVATHLPIGVEPEPAIPAHYTTYTDELGLFSISYPPDWELALSQIEGLTQDVEDYLEGIGSEGSLVESTVVFFAGVPYGMGHNPNTSVMVTPAGEGNWRLEDLVESVVQHGYMKDAEEYHEFSRIKTVVDGREAIILDCEATYPFFATEIHVLMMCLRDNNIVWVVNCGVLSPKDFSAFETDLHAIVRSLRILK